MLDILKDVTLDTALDCLKMLPFLFFAFLLLEAVEHHTSKKTDKILASSVRLSAHFSAVFRSADFPFLRQISIRAA